MQGRRAAFAMRLEAQVDGTHTASRPSTTLTAMSAVPEVQV